MQSNRSQSFVLSFSCRSIVCITWIFNNNILWIRCTRQKFLTVRIYRMKKIARLENRILHKWLEKNEVRTVLTAASWSTVPSGPWVRKSLSIDDGGRLIVSIWSNVNCPRMFVRVKWSITNRILKTEINSMILPPVNFTKRSIILSVLSSACVCDFSVKRYRRTKEEKFNQCGKMFTSHT